MHTDTIAFPSRRMFHRAAMQHRWVLLESESGEMQQITPTHQHLQHVPVLLLLLQALRNEDDYEKFATDDSRAHVTVGGGQHLIAVSSQATAAAAAVFVSRPRTSLVVIPSGQQ